MCAAQLQHMTNHTYGPVCARLLPIHLEKGADLVDTLQVSIAIDFEVSGLFQERVFEPTISQKRSKSRDLKHQGYLPLFASTSYV